MTATAKPRKSVRVATQPRQFPSAAGALILEGAIIGRYPSGAKKGTVDEIGTDPELVIEGIAHNTVDNSAGVAAGKDVQVDEGILLLFASGLAQTDEGSIAYGVDNQTFALDSNGGTRPPIGEVWEYVSATSAYVKVGRLALAAALAPELVEATPAAPGANLTDASATIQITAGAWRSLPAATLTANRTLTLGTTGAKAGDKITVTRLDETGFTLAIANGGAGAGTLVTLPGGEIGSAAAVFDGTNWKLQDAGATTPITAVGADLANADATVQRAARVTWFTLPAATLSTNRTVTLGTTGATVGDEILVTRLDATANTLAIANGGAGAGTLVTLPVSKVNFARARFDGTNWKLMSCGTQ